MNFIQLANFTSAGLSRRFHHLRCTPDREPHVLLLLACGLLYLTCLRPDERPTEPLILGFEYSASTEASAIRVAYLMPDGGECFIHHQLQILLACVHRQFALHAMLAAGSRDHLEHHYSCWNKENGTRGLLVLGIHVDDRGHLSAEPREGRILNPGSRPRQAKARAGTKAFPTPR